MVSIFPMPPPMESFVSGMSASVRSQSTRKLDFSVRVGSIE